MKPARKNLLLILAVLLWVAALLAALWWYQARCLRAFDEQAALFDSSALQLPGALAGNGEIHLVHFWDPACPCNRGNQQHLADLVKRFAAQGVRFHHVQKPGTRGQLPAMLATLQPLELPGSASLPASPAVALWDRQGRLAYFGPYSEGASCNSSNSFIDPVLEALVAGRQVKVGNNLAVGCFCSW